MAKALDEDLETLVGDGRIDPKPSAAPSRQLGFKASPQLRLAYDLVSHRYGPSRREIIELAPLLFTLLAEGSLAWRRQCLEEVDEAMAHLSDLGEKSQLYFAKYLPHAEEGRDMEEDSIGKNDLLGDTMRDETQYTSWLSVFTDDHYAVTPFADYLRKLGKDLKISGKVDFFPETNLQVAVGESDEIWGADPYQVCRDELNEITGGSESACSALAYGDVQLSDIPKELMTPDAKEKRVAWLEEMGAEGAKQRERMVEKLREALLLNEDLGPSPTDIQPQEGGERHD